MCPRGPSPWIKLNRFQGLAVLTVLKAGCLGSGRFGSGLVVARLGDGRWSAPSAIGTAGAGFGGQIGFELTDFVFILNDYAAVKTFAQQGSISLGGKSTSTAPAGSPQHYTLKKKLTRFKGTSRSQRDPWAVMPRLRALQV